MLLVVGRRRSQVVGRHHSEAVVKAVIPIIGSEGSDMVMIVFEVESVGVVATMCRQLSLFAGSGRSGCHQYW